VPFVIATKGREGFRSRRQYDNAAIVSANPAWAGGDAIILAEPMVLPQIPIWIFRQVRRPHHMIFNVHVKRTCSNALRSSYLAATGQAPLATQAAPAHRPLGLFLAQPRQLTIVPADQAQRYTVFKISVPTRAALYAAASAAACGMLGATGG